MIVYILSKYIVMVELEPLDCHEIPLESIGEVDVAWTGGIQEVFWATYIYCGCFPFLFLACLILPPR